MSAATIWEIGIKVGLKKLSLSMPYREWMNKAIADLGLTLLPITVEYADVQAGLPKHHGDPFDRLLAAQASREYSAGKLRSDLRSVRSETNLGGVVGAGLLQRCLVDHPMFGLRIVISPSRPRASSAQGLSGACGQKRPPMLLGLVAAVHFVERAGEMVVDVGVIGMIAQGPSNAATASSRWPVSANTQPRFARAST